MMRVVVVDVVVAGGVVVGDAAHRVLLASFVYGRSAARIGGKGQLRPALTSAG